MSRNRSIAVGLFALGLGFAPPLSTAAAAGSSKSSKSAKTAGGDKGKAAASASKGAEAGKAGEPAGAKADSYEALRAGAQAAGDLGHLLEPLYAECKSTTDFGRRQCEQIRAWHLARIKNTKWIAVADATALQSQPYDADAKTLTLNVLGCVSCAKPPTIAGAPRVVATAAPKGFEEGNVPIGLDLSSHDLPFPDAKKAAFWSDKVRPRLRVEYVFDVGAPFDAKTVKGVAITPVAHRIYNTCNGEVIASVPPSKEPVKLAGPRDPICPPADAPSDEEIEKAKQQAQLPDTLTRADIEKAMQPVQQRIFECGQEFEAKQGVARVKFVVTGDGKFTHQIQDPYDKGDIALCLKAAIREAKFLRFKESSPAVKIDYPFVLRQ